MKKRLIAFIFLAILVISFQFGNSLLFRAGYQRLDMNSEYWEQKLKDLGMNSNSMQGAFIGVGYKHSLSRKFSFDIEGGLSKKDMFSEKSSERHFINLSILSMELNVNWLPLGYRKDIYPYIGAGGGIYYWTYKQIYDVRDIIDLSPYYNYIGKIVSMGINVKAGIIFRIGKIIGYSIEGKYRLQRGFAFSGGIHIFLWN